MAVNLQKGQKVDLTKTNPGLKKLVVGLGWDTNKYDSGGEFDLDASAFLLTAGDKAPSEKYFIFYNNPKSDGDGVMYMGDNKTGAGEGDDEQIKIDLSKMPADVEKVDFTVTIYDAETRKQNFGQVSNAFIRIVNEETNEELLRFDMAEDFSTETALVFGQLYKNGTEWKFTAVGKGYQGGLKALCESYGLQT